MYGKWAVPTMKMSIGSEKIVFWRDAISARRPLAAASGFASPPACTLRALSITTFWLRQMIPHTFTNIVSASRTPVAMLMPGIDLK